MSARHISRAVILQTLFGIDSDSWDTKKVGQLIGDNEDILGGGDSYYTKQLIDVVLAKKEEIDEVIIKAAPEWPLDKIATMDRNILRIGLAELLFNNVLGVPPKVAINEAIELAKEYGGDSSSKFVNGVLGNVYKEIGEPRKDEGKAHQDNPDKVEDLAGAVVYAYDGDDIYLALVHDIFGHWTLSKGKIEEDETSEECAVREIKEEMNLDIKIIETIGNNEYIANDPEHGRKSKQVTY
ncbi:MAG: transcription antitermination factor NusB, partial [Candidatus Pacebacteria bacterium]|nr:transcription antitermination factor NusB [Candidatus Paceibacterota bacterium]